MKTLLRRFSAAVVALAVAASAGKLTAREASAASCVVNHSSATVWDGTSNLSDNGSYLLNGSVELITEIAVTGDVTLCLNGQTITAASESRVFNVNSGASLTICDCKGSGKITGGEEEKGGGIYVDNGGALILNSGVISGNNATEGGGVYINNGGKFTMTGGTISDNTTTHQGGGVYVCGSSDNVGEFTMSGGLISDNKVNIPSSTKTDGGGGVYTAGKFTMKNSSIISDNKVTIANADNCYGGGVCVSGTKAVFTLEKGTLLGNSAKYGGGVHVSDKGKFEMIGGTIGDGNKAENGGGGVSVGGGEFVLQGGTISNNNTQRRGGGVYLSEGTATINGGKVSGNEANDGGGAYLGGGTLNISGGEISKNTATSNGGGAYLNGGTLDMSGGAITSNTAKTNGCGVYFNDGTMRLQNTVTITSPKNSQGLNSNVFLKTGKTITIGSGFKATTPIGVHPEQGITKCTDPVVPATTFANDATVEDISKQFKADREPQIVFYEGNQVKLKGPHNYDKDTWKHTPENHWNTCTICGDELPPESHNWDKGVITKQPTYTEQGVKTYTCVDCGEIKTELIAIKTSGGSGNGGGSTTTNNKTDTPYNPPTGIVISIAPTALAALGVISLIGRKKK